jgi:regulatory protein
MDTGRRKYASGNRSPRPPLEQDSRSGPGARAESNRIRPGIAATLPAGWSWPCTVSEVVLGGAIRSSSDVYVCPCQEAAPGDAADAPDRHLLCTLRAETVAGCRIGVGDTVQEQDVLRWLTEDAVVRGWDEALTILSARQRSAAELSQQLIRRGYDPAAVGRILARLTSGALIDDQALARRLVETAWDQSSHLSWQAVRMQLLRRGIPATVIDALSDEFDWDELPACMALARRRLPEIARKVRAGRVQGAGMVASRTRTALMGYLGRRGFRQEAIMRTIASPEFETWLQAGEPLDE